MLDKLSSIEENHFSEYFWRQVLGDCRSNSVYLAHFASVCLWSRMNEFMSPPCFFSVAALLGPFTSPTFRKEPFPLPLSFLSLWRWSLQPLRFRNKQTSRVFKTLTDLNVISRCNFIHLKRPWARQPLPLVGISRICYINMLMFLHTPNQPLLALKAAKLHAVLIPVAPELASVSAQTVNATFSCYNLLLFCYYCSGYCCCFWLLQ